MNAGPTATPATPGRQRGVGRRPSPSLIPDLRTKYLRLIEEWCGLRLSDQQVGRLDELVAQLLGRSGAGTPDRLYEALASSQRHDLLDALAAGLTVPETHFFRVGPQMEALRRHVLPELLRRRWTERRLALWSAGCSTGEESYTLAILLRELLPSIEEWRIEILGTDLNPTVLAQARESRYTGWSFRDTPPAIRERYFTPEGKDWRLIEPVRRLVRFAQHNLVADASPTPASGFDMILCRNVTIYFGPDTTQRLYRRFVEALAPDGWLLLGPSDATPEAATSLTPVYLDGAILWQRGARPRLAPAARAPVTAPVTAEPSPLGGGGQRRGPGYSGERPAGAGLRPHPAGPPLAPADGAAQVWALVHDGDRLAACEVAARLARAAPLNGEIHLVLGLLLLEEGDTGPALEALRRVALLDRDNALAHVGLGRAYRQLGSWDRARAALGQARRILAPLPDQATVTGGDGMTAVELRRTVDALLAERAGGTSR